MFLNFYSVRKITIRHFSGGPFCDGALGYGLLSPHPPQSGPAYHSFHTCTDRRSVTRRTTKNVNNILPKRHVQEYVVCLLVHTPPFLHGRESHWSITSSQVRPLHPEIIIIIVTGRLYLHGCIRVQLAIVILYSIHKFVSDLCRIRHMIKTRMTRALINPAT